MMKTKLIHVGHKPKGEVYQEDNDFKVWREDLPDGGVKYWNAVTMNSGCGNVLEPMVMKGNLIYCPFCDEMVNKNQFIQETE